MVCPLKHDATMQRTLQTDLKVIDISNYFIWHGFLQRKALEIQAQFDHLLFSYEYRRIQEIKISV